VLELSPSATDVEAKKAYREAVRLNHPDKVAHMSKAIQRFAHERMLLINAAWETIQKERGIR
jgi:DnaJ like chaperone protein